MKIPAILILAGAAVSAQAVVITEWDFNASVTGGASIGTGTFSTVNTTGSSASGVGSSDPTGGTNNSFNTAGYQAQGAGSGTAGVKGVSSTVGYTNIIVELDLRNSATASRWYQFEYSTDGTTFTNTGLAGGGVFSNSSNGTTFQNNYAFDMSAISGVSNNAAFAFRVTSIFAPSTSAYQAVGNTSTYGTAGTARFDMVQVMGAPVPEPASMAALGLGVAAMIRRRNKK